MFSFEEPSDEYIFRMPFASSIHPDYIKPNEILPILHEINASMAPFKRLPLEMVIKIKDEVHSPNPVWEDIRSTWSAVPINIEDVENSDNQDLSNEDVRDKDLNKPVKPPTIILDAVTMKYRIVYDLPRRLSYGHPLYYATLDKMSHHMSSADWLYRLRCLFPEVYIDPFDGYKAIWSVDIHHRRTGLVLTFSERKGAAQLDSFFERICEDCVKLMNALVGMADTGGERRLAFFHPAATATRPANEPRYPAVPIDIVRERFVKERNGKPFTVWLPVEVSATDLLPSSPFRSLLPSLIYDVKYRMIDPVNGTTPLTEVISSALLHYRLRGKYYLERHGNAAVQDDGSDALTATSVWQMKFVYSPDRYSRYRYMLAADPSPEECYLLFMDDRGLFDIRVSGNAAGVMDHITAMINELLSDSCTHPYDYLVSGCIA